MKPLHSKHRLQRLMTSARGGALATASRAANDASAQRLPELLPPYEWPAVLDGWKEPVFVHDEEGRILRCNAAYVEKAGVAMSEIVGEPYWRILPKLQEEPPPGGEEPCGKIGRFSTDEGRTLVNRSVAAHRPAGEFWYCQHLLEDVTERERLERDLAREKATLNAIVDSAPNLFFLIDQDAKLVRWNDYLRQKSSLPDEELRGRSAVSLIHPDDRALASAKLLMALATGYARMEVRSADSGPTPPYFLTTARRVMIDSTPHVAGFCVDISDRKRTEKSLEEQKAFLDGLVENIPGVFCVLDTEGNYLRWNTNLNRLTGLSDHELLNRSSLMDIAEYDRAPAAQRLREVFETGYVRTVLHVLTKDRGTRSFLMTGRRFQINGTLYAIGVGIDATDQLETIRSLEQEARTDGLTQLPNRAHFLEHAMHEFARCRRYGHSLSIWMLDLDHFKNVNDTYGHPAGDTVLRAFVVASQQALRDWDIMGRMGGEEFAVLLPETAADQALLVAERFRQTVAGTAIPVGTDASVSITVSIGIATVTPEDHDVQAMLARADAALYSAKTTGRDKVWVG